MPDSRAVPNSSAERSQRVGLCSDCAHARALRSAKGSEFWLCERGKADPRYLKYPSLPVRACLGFARAEPTR